MSATLPGSKRLPDLTRWRATWMGLGVAAPDERLFSNIIASYSEPHRHYHTTQHLGECFAWLDGARSLADHFHEVELALWFHDAVYQVRSQDNEEQSAAWAQSAATKPGWRPSPFERCSRPGPEPISLARSGSWLASWQNRNPDRQTVRALEALL